MDEDSTRWTVHGTRRVYASDWVNVDLDDVEIPQGPRFEHHVLRFPRASVGAVVVDSGQVLLLWRHRFATDTSGWEIPAGWSEPDEHATTAVRREVLEETGYDVRSVEPLTTYHPLSGISSQRYQLFVGTNARLIKQPDESESALVQWHPIRHVSHMLARDEIVDGPSLTALAYYVATCS